MTRQDIDKEIDELYTREPMFHSGYGHTIPSDFNDYEEAWKAKLSSLLQRARQFDEFGNPIVVLNMYEAKAVAKCLKSLVPLQVYDTGDWFRDVPFKIEQRIKALNEPKEGEV